MNWGHLLLTGLACSFPGVRDTGGTIKPVWLPLWIWGGSWRPRVGGQDPFKLPLKHHGQVYKGRQGMERN